MVPSVAGFDTGCGWISWQVWSNLMHGEVDFGTERCSMWCRVWSDLAPGVAGFGAGCGWIRCWVWLDLVP